MMPSTSLSLPAWHHGSKLTILGHLLGSSGTNATSAWVQMGGMGFLHYNMTKEEQVQQAKRVKQHVPGFVTRPATLAPQSTIADFESLKVLARSACPPHISGFAAEAAKLCRTSAAWQCHVQTG